jgi:uncharacterized membrane protein
MKLNYGNTILALSVIILITSCNPSNNKNSFENIQLKQNLSKEVIEKIQIKWDKDSITQLSNFYSVDNDVDSSIMKSSYAKFVDIDNNGKRELQAGFNNGGAAGIETLGLFIENDDSFFKPIFIWNGSNEFNGNVISFYFSSITKYFHACGACDIWLPIDIIPVFKLKLNDDKLSYLETNKDDQKAILKNLDYLRRKGDFTTDESGEDKGTRKAYLTTLILHYYNNNGDLNSTKKLFNKYYPFSDKENIWNEIRSYFPLLELVNVNENSIGIKETDKQLSDPNVLIKQIKNKQVDLRFEGFGTEPFWTIYITNDEVLYSPTGNEYSIYRLMNAFDENKKSQVIQYADKEGKIHEVIIKKEPSGDGMSDRTYPYRVVWSELNGAGDSKLMSNMSEYEK